MILFAAAAGLSACSDSAPAPPAEAERAAPSTPSAAPVAPKPPAKPEATPALVITTAGYDQIRIGDPPSAAADYALADDGSFTDECRIHASKKLPGAYAIVEKGIVQRLSFGQRASGDIRTDRGIAVGDSIDAVRRAYPGIREEPHEYVTPDGRYLTMGGDNGQPGIRFETDAEGRVTIIHVGRQPVLGYVEGCA